jgi:hypothetical protein
LTVSGHSVQLTDASEFATCVRASGPRDDLLIQSNECKAFPTLPPSPNAAIVTQRYRHPTPPMRLVVGVHAICMPPFTINHCVYFFQRSILSQLV